MSKIKEHLVKEETNQLPPMTGQEVADELGISRQAVSKTLKRAMEKVYKEFMKANKSGPFETAVSMATGFNAITDSDAELKKFFKLFPPKIRKEIEEDAAKQMPKFKKK